MYKKIWSYSLLAAILMVQSCAFKEFKNADEQEVYNKFQELKKSERYILASEYAKKFKEHFPKSDKVEELDLFIADQEYRSENWESAKERYKTFLEVHPKSQKAPYAQEQLKTIEVEMVSFHKHFDYNIFVGPQLFSIGDLNRATEATDYMTHLSISYYPAPNHGFFIGGQSHTFKAKGNKITEASGRKNKKVQASIISLGYLHRWKVFQKANVVYGIGVGGERIQFSDGKAPNNKRTLGFNQFITFDYCALSQDNGQCWNGLFPSIGLFHLYSPSGTLGGNDMKGHLFGLGFGLRM